MADLKAIASQVRRDIVRMVHGAQSGHPGGSLGCADYFTALYFKILKHDPNFHMDAKNEDIFFLSNGHISPVFYSALARSGYFDIKELTTFRKINSRLQGHPTTHEHLPGIRVASGSLGQGMSVAIGAALSKKLNNDKNIVFTLHGDGELDEGQNWEAIMFAAKYNLHNLIVIIDRNNIQIDGNTETVMPLEPLRDKWEAFGWHVQEIDGQNVESLIDACSMARAVVEQPSVIIAHTIPGKGVPFMEYDYHWHHGALNPEQAKEALKKLRSMNGKISGDHD